MGFNSQWVHAWHAVNRLRRIGEDGQGALESVADWRRGPLVKDSLDLWANLVAGVAAVP
jgi:hypothetical protein